jgi:hypothetical protein
MTWSRSLRWLLPLVCLLLAGPAALSAEEVDLGCLFAAPVTENAPSEPALLAVEGLPAPLPASSPCGTCSLPGCRFRTVGEACVTPAGTPGNCFYSGKVCFPGSSHCGCG